MSEKAQTQRGTRRERQELWRERLPELCEVVEDLAPAIWRRTEERRIEDVPEEWKALVSRMRARVHADADSTKYHPSTMTLEDRRGHHWWPHVGRVGDMLEYLTRMIREDLGFDDGATLGSIALLRSAVQYLECELRDGNQEGEGERKLEHQWRIHTALRALSPEFDSPHMRRLRVLQTAEAATRLTHIPDDEEIEARVQRCAEFPGTDTEKTRDFVAVDQPAMTGVMARSWLSEVDERFSKLDPLVGLEEFAEAARTPGGRAEGGGGKTGPARAVARLCLMCGALDYEQNSDEGFDDAVERVRNSLLVSKSRLRKEVLSFPTGSPPANDPEPEYQVTSKKVERNASCPCGSGRKYKKCCGAS